MLSARAAAAKPPLSTTFTKIVMPSTPSMASHRFARMPDQSRSADPQRLIVVVEHGGEVTDARRVPRGAKHLHKTRTDLRQARARTSLRPERNSCTGGVTKKWAPAAGGGESCRGD